MSPLKDWLNLFAVSVNATVSEAIFGKFFFGKILLILMLLQYRSNVHVSWQSRLETWFLILEVFENQESNFEAQVSSFDFRGSRTKFRDTRRIFRGSWTEISRKRFNSRKQNNIDEQNNWCPALFTQTLCWMYANIFLCCAISTRHMRFTYLHWSWWQQTKMRLQHQHQLAAQNVNER